MNLFKNFSIKKKLLLLISLPLIGLLYFSIVQNIDSLNNLNRISKIEIIADLSTNISSLLHETQKERGMTAGYIGSAGKKFKDKLPKQRVLTNKQFAILENVVSTIDFNNYSKSFQKRMDNAIKLFKGLNNIRPKVDSLNIKASKAIAYYTNMNTLFLDNIVSIAKLSDDAQITQQITAYSSFLLSKERAGIERAVGTNTLGRDSFGKGMRTKFNDLISAQNSYLKTFQYYATDSGNAYYDEMIVNKSIIEVDRIREIMLTSNEIGGFNQNSEYWFDTITKKINLLKKVENKIRDTLRISNSDVKQLVNIASSISNLLHETQKERGATAGFIGSKGTKFVTKLPNQRLLTNKRIKKLEIALSSNNIKSAQVKSLIKISLNSLGKINSIRSRINTLDISAKEAISYYTKMNGEFLDIIARMAKAASNINESRDLTAFYNFLMSKERAGIERAILSNTFSRNKFLPGMKKKFIILMTEQNAFLTSFKASARVDLINFYKNNLKGSDVDEVNRLRELALKTQTIGGFNIEATHWFSQITNKINILKKIDDFLSKEVLTSISQKKASAKSSLISTSVLTILILLIVLFIARNITIMIISSLDKFKEGLGFFFQYAVREKDYLKPMAVEGTDEFAQMTIDMNKQILKTEALIEQDKKVVSEIDEVMQKVKSGFFVFTIKEKGATVEVETLRVNINNMLNETKQKLDRINKILDAFASGQYSLTLTDFDKKVMNGDMGSLLMSSKLLGTSVSHLMAMISNAGEELSISTNTLQNSSTALSNAANNQAASLEETAASIEEITANIQNNTKNVLEMSTLADSLTKSAKIGVDLANETVTSMEDINDKVSNINEAIEVIDQIAFQTNILSLNAAVEAATAGEAGKGFAVVAQEVRNLASRSADAARDIKELVEDASTRSSVGKVAATKMIEGYGDLNKKIIQTKDIIDNVTVASQEQESGMIQINDAINSLDKATQENANTASSIDRLSNNVASLASRLTDITLQAKIENHVKEEVCDISLLQEVSKYKNDHINFKDVNFAKLDSFKNWEVTKPTECKFGKWIILSENENRIYTKSAIWAKIKTKHNTVHEKVQEYVTSNATEIENGLENLENIAIEIETATHELFDDMDGLLKANCENQS